MVLRLPNAQEGRKVILEACIAGKQHKAAFEDGKAWMGNAALDFMHCDICRHPRHRVQGTLCFLSVVSPRCGFIS
jgi:hypothetical protein